MSAHQLVICNAERVRMRRSSASRRAHLRPVVNCDVVAQEEMRRFESDGEGLMELGKLHVCRWRVSVHHLPVVNVHDNVHARAVIQEFPKIARVILGLTEALTAKLLD